MNFRDSNYNVNSLIANKRAKHEAAAERSTKRQKKCDSPLSVINQKTSIALSSSSTSSSSSAVRTLSKEVIKKPQRNALSMAKVSVKSADEILALILNWNAFWLKECITKARQNCDPPPLCPDKELIPLKLFYETTEEYRNIYIPLILHETWAEMSEDYAKSKEHDNGGNVFKIAVSPSYGAEGSFIVISCQSAVSKSVYKNGKYPSEGDLCVLELMVENEPNGVKKMMVFAYVNDLTIEDLKPKCETLPNLIAPHGPCVLLRSQIKILRKNININCRQLMQIKSVFYLRPMLRKIETLLSLEHVILRRDILKPREMTCKYVVPSDMKFNDTEYNQSQYRAIKGCCEAVYRPYLIPKLLMIQGPPGTGKTHTLIGIIKEIYMTCNDPNALPRILICAPSNGAVDEIARRLYRERRFLHKRPNFGKRYIRIVRIGQPSQIHSEVQKMTLDSLIQTNMENNKDAVMKNELLIEEKISKLDQEMANCRSSGNINGLRRAEEELMHLAKKVQITNNTIPNKGVDIYHDKRRLKCEIMEKADIIITTLNSCRQSSIEALYKIHGANTFSCVIVDEASQCSEPELLMPLMYGITKMILIGDPMQLPATVISKKANDYHYGRSLFERFFKYFGGDDEHPEEVVLMLNEQYRMNPEICAFPSQQFYSGKLKTNHIVLKRHFPLRPYIIIDLLDSYEDAHDPKNKFNSLEANFVVRIVTIIDQMIPSESTVGIVTPYQGQKKFIADQLFNFKDKINIKPEINTIDGFQGQERDVIILSCVRAFEYGKCIGFLKSTQRMNVALTRAKHSLIVCISGRALENDAQWKTLIENAKSRSRYFKMTSYQKSEIIASLVKNPLVPDQ